MAETSVEKPKRWELKAVCTVIYDNEHVNAVDGKELNDLLAVGWEPFAVTSHLVWLKKRSDADA